MDTDDKLTIGGCGCLIVVFILMVIFSAWVALSTRTQVRDTVVKSERVCSGGESGTCRYLVFAKKEVYQNRDTFWYWKFNSSDLYRDIENGKTYNFTVYGFRVPFLSWYRNIIKVD